MTNEMSVSREIHTETGRVFKIMRVFGKENLKELFADYVAEKISSTLVEQAQGGKKTDEKN